jgi:hypothetical protein
LLGLKFALDKMSGEGERENREGYHQTREMHEKCEDVNEDEFFLNSISSARARRKLFS